MQDVVRIDVPLSEKEKVQCSKFVSHLSESSGCKVSWASNGVIRESADLVFRWGKVQHTGTQAWGKKMDRLLMSWQHSLMGRATAIPSIHIQPFSLSHTHISEHGCMRSTVNPQENQFVTLRLYFTQVCFLSYKASVANEE